MTICILILPIPLTDLFFQILEEGLCSVHLFLEANLSKTSLIRFVSKEKW